MLLLVLVSDAPPEPGSAAEAAAAHPAVVVRRAIGTDLGDVLALYDEAVAWLAALGRADQWGTAPFTSRPEVVAMIRGRVRTDRMWLARAGSRTVGAIVLGGPAPSYIPVPAGEPEIYLSGFVTTRAPEGREAGRALLAYARDTARRAGIGVLRLDCYAGGDGALVRYYESAGFRRVARFTVELLGSPYRGCLLEQRLPPG
ncbi:GNAT family N-acetyltransferase [Plantactinospora siamensis]|uniref:GNAT family N-acetyltransferase n=1 Tax=Plantactinospora siamensis TaxID=555372 RepID=A0ABV6NUX4_9ACTN